MRINVEKYRAIAESKQITDEQVRKSTGLSEKTFEWIMENRFIEAGTLELIADVLGCDTQDIATEDRTGSSENVIEWVKDAKTAVITLTQGRYISRIRQLAVDRPNECKIICNNADGSICAKIPTKWVKITPTLNLTEEQRKKIGERLNKTR